MSIDKTPERRQLVSLAQEMLQGTLSFFEGASQILAVRSKLQGISERDPDFDVFVAICSETDHLPLKEQQQLWAPEEIERLGPEYLAVEEWARLFGLQACKNLIERFG